jgi:hypothetical protein
MNDLDLENLQKYLSARKIDVSKMRNHLKIQQYVVPHYEIEEAIKMIKDGWFYQAIKTWQKITNDFDDIVFPDDFVEDTNWLKKD